MAFPSYQGLRDEGLAQVRAIPDADELMASGAAMTRDEIVAQVFQALDAVDKSRTGDPTRPSGSSRARDATRGTVTKTRIEEHRWNH